MLLFDSLHMASTALNASQLGIQVAGQNLSNSQTPGYIREQLVLETGTTRKLGNGQAVGTGVSVSGVVQVIDNFLEERLRTATSDAMSSTTQQSYYTQLEALLNETTDADLSSAIEEFFNSIDNVLNYPENETYRGMAADQGEKLATQINGLYSSIQGMQQTVNQSISLAADEINRLLSEIQELNTSISMVEGGHDSRQALGLRDQRVNALSELSQYINIKTVEDAKSGQITVYCGSDILLTDKYRNEVSVGSKTSEDGGIPQAILCVGDTKSPLDVRSGAVYGMYRANDSILGDYAQKLDLFAGELISEFNKIYSVGQGTTGYSGITSLARINRPDEALSQSELESPIVNGVLKIQTFDKTTGVTTDHTPIEIKVETPQQGDPFSLRSDPKAGGTTLNDLAESINAIEGISAKVNSFGQLEITADDPSIEFAFAGDTSGVLSALGMNTFFTGNSAGTIGVNQTVLDDPSKFAASLGGVGNDTDNGVRLAALAVNRNGDLGNKSLPDFYNGLVGETMLAAGTMKSVASTDTLYYQSLQTQRDSISGVNIDEETIAMMTYQRMYQANSRFITTVNDILDVLFQI